MAPAHVLNMGLDVPIWTPSLKNVQLSCCTVMDSGRFSIRSRKKWKGGCLKDRLDMALSEVWDLKQLIQR